MLHSIQLLRFIAAFAVVLSHAEYVFGSLRDNRSLSYVFGLGAIGVHIFFVISGFIMTYTVFSRPEAMAPLDFLRRRFIRIYPIYWIYAVLYIVVLKLDLSPSDIVSAAFLLPGHSSQIIGQGWTLSYEVFFYVCFAAVIPLGPRLGLATLSAIFLILVALHPLLRTRTIFSVTTNPLLIEFLFGSWIGLAYIKGYWLPPAKWTAFAAILLIFCGYFFGYQRETSVLMWGIPSALLITAALAWERDGVLKWIRHLSFLGDSSYSLYLLHAVMLVLISRWFGVPDQFVLTCFVASAACAILAMPPYYMIERPLVRTLNSLFKMGLSRRIARAQSPD